MKYVSRVNDKQYFIEIDQENSQVIVDGTPHHIDFEPLAEGGLLSLLLDNRSIEAVVEDRREHWEVLIEGELYTVVVQDELRYQLSQLEAQTGGARGTVAVQSPMPGIIIKIPVAVGDEVASGATVAILESMKMENELKSPRDGVVRQVLVEAGASVEKGQELVLIGDPQEDEPEDEIEA